MTDGPDRKTAELDRVVAERLAAIGPFDPSDFQPQVLRDVFALAQRWRSALLADAAPSQAVPGAPDKPR